MVPEPERGVLSADTSFEVEQRQIALWRGMSTAERFALVNGASRAVRTLAMAGLKTRYPDAADSELIARLALVTLGDGLARRAYPELDSLEP